MPTDAGKMQLGKHTSNQRNEACGEELQDNQPVVLKPALREIHGCDWLSWIQSCKPCRERIRHQTHMWSQHIHKDKYATNVKCYFVVWQSVSTAAALHSNASGLQRVNTKKRQQTSLLFLGKIQNNFQVTFASVRKLQPCIICLRFATPASLKVRMQIIALTQSSI